MTSPLKLSRALPHEKTGRMAGLHWPNPDKPALVLLHANGLCALSYRKFLEPFMTDYDVRVLELRGHGDTDLPADPSQLKSWHTYKEDVIAFLKQDTSEDLKKGMTLIGHSCGAIASLLVTAENQLPIKNLVMIEPVVLPDFLVWAMHTPLLHLLGPRIPIVANAKKRRRFFVSRDAARQSYKQKPFFQRWDEDVLEDYLQQGFHETSNGVALSCDPQWEAATFMAQRQKVWPTMRKIQAQNSPMPHLIYGEHGSTTPLQARRRFSQFGTTAITIGKTHHLVPQEQPLRTAETIKQMLHGDV